MSDLLSSSSEPASDHLPQSSPPPAASSIDPFSPSSSSFSSSSSSLSSSFSVAGRRGSSVHADSASSSSAVASSSVADSSVSGSFSSPMAISPSPASPSACSPPRAASASASASSSSSSPALGFPPPTAAAFSTSAPSSVSSSVPVQQQYQTQSAQQYQPAQQPVSASASIRSSGNTAPASVPSSAPASFHSSSSASSSQPSASASSPSSAPSSASSSSSSASPSAAAAAASAAAAAATAAMYAELADFKELPAIKLATTREARALYDNLADLFSLLVTTEHVEKAYVKDSISNKDYTAACGKLIAQYKTLKDSLVNEVPDLESFCREYGLNVKAAENRFKVGVPATILHGDVGKTSSGKELTVFHAVQHFITAMDSLKLNMKAVDELHPNLTDLMDSINKVPNLPVDHEAKTKVREWLVQLSGMKAHEELNDEQIRQMSFDLDSAYNSFHRFVKEGPSK